MTKQTATKLRELDDILAELIPVHIVLIRLWQRAATARFTGVAQELGSLKNDIPWAKQCIQEEKAQLLRREP